MGTAAAMQCEDDGVLSDNHSCRRTQHLLRHCARDGDDPENVIAEAIVRTLYHRPVSIPFIPWARVVARHLVIDDARGRGSFASKAHLLNLGVNLPVPDDVPELLDIRTAITLLPAREREAIAFRYYLDLPLSDVARHMRVSIASTRSTLFRARRTLSELLGDHYIR